MFYSKVLLLLAATTDVFGYSIRESPQVGIINGNPVPISDVPYVVNLRYNYTNTKGTPGHLCGGTILSERFILTAAHCCKASTVTSKYTVAVGSENIDKGDIYDVEKIIPHEKFDWSIGDNDICLVKLTKNITFGANVTKVELANEHLELKAGMMLNATGWGFTTRSSFKISDILRLVTVPLVEHGICAEIYKNYYLHITDRMICAGVYGKGVDHGDSGGPLMWKNKQVGIASFINTKCTEYPAVFTNISSQLSWIGDNIASNS